MDYSTISNKTNCTVTEEINDAELSEKYYSLKKQYDNLANNFEATKQELHDTRRSYNTALDVQRHITAELESHQADEAKRRSEWNSRIAGLQEDICALREERTQSAEKHAMDIKRFEEDIKKLKEELSLKPTRESPEKDYSELDEMRGSLGTALNDAAEARAALEEARLEIASWRCKVEELASDLSELREAAVVRREEVRAAVEREATALAELAEARAMLHQCTEVQDNTPHAAKGNSIFAEVEDKRQEMAKNLIQMKQTNTRLRRDLANKQAELDALLHEKQTVWEQQAGASAHYDRELIESYEERISQLEGACEQQRRELCRWFGKMADPAAPGWLPAVMDHLRTECARLRGEVLSRGAASLASAAALRDLRRALALATANNTNNTSNTNDVATQLTDDVISKALTKTRPLADRTNVITDEVVKPETKVRPAHDDVRKKVSFN